MMLIKTSDTNRLIEKMLEKSTRRRRLARRLDRNHEIPGDIANAAGMVTAVVHGMSAYNRALHHAKAHAMPIKGGQNLAPGRRLRDALPVTRRNAFGDPFL